MRKVTACGLGIAFALYGFSGTLAQAQSETPSPCASITDDKSRLQCYDAEHALKRSQPAARPAASAPSAASAPQSATPPAAASASQPSAAPSAAPVPAPAALPAPAPKVAAPVAANPAATSGSADTEFGKETLPKTAKKAAESDEATEITAKVSAVTGQRKGDYRVTLDNGQVWAETQRTGGDAPSVGDTVVLRRGAMGSYFLSHGKGLALRVRRVK